MIIGGSMSNILVIDDDPRLRQSFQKLLVEEGYTVWAAANANSGLSMIHKELPDAVIMDIRMPGMNGLEALQQIHTIEPKLPVIIMTAYGTTETAIEATKLGAFDYILKPFDIPDTLELIEKALKAGHFMRSKIEINTEPNSMNQIKNNKDIIIGRSILMQEVYKSIGKVAATDATVLIRGESGTGKELIARAIYQHSLRNQRPFLVINCVAIPETLLESELFGYEKGAFTGAFSRRIGKIEQAHKGSVFLDEIGDMPFNIQSKILRLLQEKSIERLGGHHPIPVDVRIIAATNRDLEKAVSEGKFREDLYYRLNVVSLNLPSLKNRKEDIPLLADFFLNKFSQEMKIENPGMTHSAIETLSVYNWPGNIRELANAIQKAIIFNQGMPIDKKDIIHVMGSDKVNKTEHKLIDDKKMDEVLHQWFQQKLNQYQKGFDQSSESFFDSLMEHFASILIKETLCYTKGNRTQASKILGISRPTLLSRIEKYKFKFETSVQ